MSEDIIAALIDKAKSKQEELNQLKKLINSLCSEVGREAPYPDVSDSSHGLAGIRSDQFYGQTLTAAIRNYLEIRKAANLGAASVTDIYRAIRDGGYKFGTNNEENAKISVGNALRKTSSVFHRLPNGQYGLLVWYPSAKSPQDDEDSTSSKRHRPSPVKVRTTIVTKIKNDQVTNEEIRNEILSREGEFQVNDVEAAIKSKYPTKELPKTKIPSVLFLLKKKGFVRMVAPRSGKKGAIWSKA